MDIALRYAARSDVGLVRLNNQDSGYAGAHLLVVADGMGGHAGGDVASAITVGALMHLDAPAANPDAALADLELAVDDARQDLVDRSAKDPELTGMGTTVTAVMLVDNRLAMAHLGDSRAYVLRDGELTQATIDHTFVQHLVDTGRISAEEAETHPQRNVVMRVLGDFDIDLTPDLSVREATVGDRWMLCSDGLSGFVHAEELRATLADVADVAQCAEDLLQQALDAGSTDNVTVIVADVIDATVDTAMTEREVVGAAAIEDLVEEDFADHDDVSSDGDALTLPAVDSPDHAPTPESDVDAQDLDQDHIEEEERPRRRRWILLVSILLVLAGLVAGGWAGYRWTQSQYYLGISEGKVAIFQGVPASVGPLTLSHVVEHGGASVEELPPFVADRLRATISESSLDAARAHLAELLVEANSTDTPSTTTPQPSPSPSTDGGT